MGATLLSFFVASQLYGVSAAAVSVQGCGGFVEASPSLVKARKLSDRKMDYSSVIVELQTLDGLVKERIQCAPNGYYFIPVYDKGSFVIRIKGPNGWSWDPANVPVVVDTNGCNANADVNFQLTGFMISGTVQGAVGGASCSAKNGGPSDVKVELLSLTDEIISSAFTSSEGNYSFENIVPGKYKLRASHPDIKVENRYFHEVDLGVGNSNVGDLFFVPGYNIHGFVVSQGDPILGVHIYLCSDDILEVNCPQGVGSSPFRRNVLCHTISDAEGKFMFSMVPCGKYELLPYYKGENTVFDVLPASVDVSVEHHHVTLAQKFQVTGFSVGGRVVDGNGFGIEGVCIKIDGLKKSMTDSNGHYKLDQVTSKPYTITAEKEHHKFSSLQSFKVLPNMASIPDIKGSYYDICGIISSTSAYYSAKVALTHGPENVKPQVKEANEDGSFCFEVPPGEYRLSVITVASESPGLIYLPPFIDIVVTNPILDLKFSQALVEIQGSVICKENCGPSVNILLTQLTGEHKEEQKIPLAHDNNEFKFPQVLPGSYRIEVKHNSLLEEDNWCWEQGTVNLTVGIEDVKGITFIQKGYWVNIISSHNVDVSVHHLNAAPLRLTIKKGSQRICMEQMGMHELRFHSSCVFFGHFSVLFDPSTPLPLYLKGEKYFLTGEIHIGSSSHQGFHDLSDHIVVDIFNDENMLVDVSCARMVSDTNNLTGSVVYEYNSWAKLGDNLIFVPRDTRNNEERKILFYPSEWHVDVKIDDCQASIPRFIGRMGLYIEGLVTPPVSDVGIRIIATGESRNARLQRGEVALVTKTEEDGCFVVGPLYDDTDYSIEASKPGYHLKQMVPGVFSCLKLSQILVLVYSTEDTKEFLPFVLLSLSGEDGYRNNSISGANESFLFDNLFPGNFYLRPILKEYSFSPQTQAVELESGESKEVIFYAARVAYSVMGMVSLLSGQPKEALTVEARSSNGYYEETVTDSLGNYRLRGLLPHATYTIKVVIKEIPGDRKIERVSPECAVIEVGFEDVSRLDFVVFEQLEMTILSGYVEGTDLRKLQPYLFVEVKLASDTSKIESFFPLPLSCYFQIQSLPKEKYVLQIKSRFPSVSFMLVSEIIDVDMVKQPQVHVGPLRYKIEDHERKLEQTPAPLFPLIVGVLVITLFIFMPRLKDLYQVSVGAGISGSAMVKKDIRKAVLRRKAS